MILTIRYEEVVKYWCRKNEDSEIISARSLMEIYGEHPVLHAVPLNHSDTL
jgi:hypothetical protein